MVTSIHLAVGTLKHHRNDDPITHHDRKICQARKLMIEGMNIFSAISSSIPASKNALNCIKISMMRCIDVSQGILIQVFFTTCFPLGMLAWESAGGVDPLLD